MSTRFDLTDEEWALNPGDLKKAQARAAQLQQTIQTGTGPTTSQKANAATP